MRPFFPGKGPLARQGGAVLFTALAFLIVLTLIVLAVVRGGTLEERMARNSRDRQSAIEASEAVLRDAETMFSRPPFDPYDPSKFSSECVNGYCLKPSATKTWQAVSWNASDNLTRTFDSANSNLTGLNTQPRYIVEIITPPAKTSSVSQCEDGVAKITARGQGNGGAAVFVQSTVRFRVFTNNCG